ncbi:hypothetical protein B566_EDAN018815, partial [Ephemera danica]
MQKPPEATGEPTKTQVKYRGPLVVTRVLQGDTYRVTSLIPTRGQKFFTTNAHILLLKPWGQPYSPTLEDEISHVSHTAVTLACTSVKISSHNEGYSWVFPLISHVSHTAVTLACTSVKISSHNEGYSWVFPFFALFGTVAGVLVIKLNLLRMVLAKTPPTVSSCLFLPLRVTAEYEQLGGVVSIAEGDLVDVAGDGPPLGDVCSCCSRGDNRSCAWLLLSATPHGSIETTATGLSGFICCVFASRSALPLEYRALRSFSSNALSTRDRIRTK